MGLLELRWLGLRLRLGTLRLRLYLYLRRERIRLEVCRGDKRLRRGHGVANRRRRRGRFSEVCGGGGGVEQAVCALAEKLWRGEGIEIVLVVVMTRGHGRHGRQAVLQGVVDVWAVDVVVVVVGAAMVVIWVAVVLAQVHHGVVMIGGAGVEGMVDVFVASVAMAAEELGGGGVLVVEFADGASRA